MLIGRIKEKEILLSLLESEQSEFVAVYGRRRVGKTYLVRETFNYKFAFQHTGQLDTPMSEQLSEFRESLYAVGMKKCAMPRTWSHAQDMECRIQVVAKSLGNMSRRQEGDFY